MINIKEINNMKLETSQTYKNLAKAFAAECMARTRYEFVEYGFRYNGYAAIADIIDKIAYQEFNHARMLYTKLQEAGSKEITNIEICGGFPFKEKWDMETNLKLVAEDEADEADAYTKFIDTALSEGFDDIAELFKQIKTVELRHKEVFMELYKQFKSGKLYKKSSKTIWYCPSCGYVGEGKEAWDKCPLCEAEQGVCNVVFPEGYII